MCYEFERLYQLQLAEQWRREKEKEEGEKRNKRTTPAKPAEEPDSGTREPVPA
jgi:hypothetical protein